MKKNIKLYNLGVFAVLISFILGCFSIISNLIKKNDGADPEPSVSIVEQQDDTTNAPSIITETGKPDIINEKDTFIFDDVPEYSGNAYYIVHNNVPFFKTEEITTSVFENYSDLDYLGRCGYAYANICQELMPTDAREAIGSVKPSGWTYNGVSNNNKYDFVDGKYIYNRCHLIGFQLAGENANEKNLITGTRYLNVTGMLPFENMVADYVKDTGNHVLYRVSPVFIEDELVCRGLLMEAYSVEDNGEGIEFCVYCYNVQPGVTVNYLTGQNTASQ